MPKFLNSKAIDKSTYVIRAEFFNEDDTGVVPNAITWTLTNEHGAVINGQEDNPISPPASPVDIVLSGDDLKYSDGGERVLTIEATYDSNLGTGLPLKDQVSFKITNLLLI